MDVFTYAVIKTTVSAEALALHMAGPGYTYIARCYGFVHLTAAGYE